MAEKSIATVEFAGRAAHRALIYTRLSRDQGDQTDTRLATQESLCQRYARARGWMLEATLSDVRSGRASDRIGYLNLMSYARRLRAGGVNTRPLHAATLRIARAQDGAPRERHRLCHEDVRHRRIEAHRRGAGRDHL
jgi:hypothetical protein